MFFSLLSFEKESNKENFNLFLNPCKARIEKWVNLYIVIYWSRNVGEFSCLLLLQKK